MKLNRTFWVLLVVVLVASFTTACQRNNDNGVQAAREDRATAAKAPATDKDVLNAADQETAMKIEQSHIGEIDLARLAKDHASNGDVKSYADMVESDHTGALKDVQKIMKDKGVNESTGSKPADSQAKMNDLQKLSGAAFDREFMSAMVSDHQKTLDELRSLQISVQNPDLKDYVNDLIPKVQKHLDKARDVESKITTGTTKR